MGLAGWLAGWMFEDRACTRSACTHAARWAGSVVRISAAASGPARLLAWRSWLYVDGLCLNVRPLASQAAQPVSRDVETLTGEMKEAVVMHLFPINRIVCNVSNVIVIFLCSLYVSCGAKTKATIQPRPSGPRNTQTISWHHWDNSDPGQSRGGFPPGTPLFHRLAPFAQSGEPSSTYVKRCASPPNRKERWAATRRLARTHHRARTRSQKVGVHLLTTMLVHDTAPLAS